MGDYLASLIVEPVVRQARRLSRLNTVEEPPRVLPSVPESRRTWYPTRLWNTSPPASSSSEDEKSGNRVRGDLKSVRSWTASMPSPPIGKMDHREHEIRNDERSAGPTPAPFPPLEPHVAEQPRPAPPYLSDFGAVSDSSLNPLRELPDRSRILEEDARGHSHSDPLNRVREESGASSGQSSAVMARAYYEGGGLSRSRNGSGTLPEDDGMGPLRQKINAIWQSESTVEAKSQMLHFLMTERYHSSRLGGEAMSHSPTGRLKRSRPSTPSSLRDSDGMSPGSPMSIELTALETPFGYLSPADLSMTFTSLDQGDLSQGTDEEMPAPRLGCPHYERKVKLQCHSCKKWYTCRFCHDEVEDHILPRQQTENMLCMICKTPQLAAQTCRVCGEQSSCYYCSVCKLWNNDPAKSIYHCDDCGICRLGEGLGKDFFHCQTCAVCMSIGVESTHRCIERSTKCDCPICGEYLFTSPGTVVFMRCGHSIHDSCFKDWCRASYKCPICSKSVVNMESQFRGLDRQIESQPMPDEYQNTRAYVYCNDCSRKGTTKYHWLGLKCETCESYNTQQHHLLEATDDGSASTPHSGGDDVHVAEAPPVNASPPLPANLADEAVTIPNSTAATRRPSSLSSETGVPSTPPWLPLPHPREARSLSPTPGNYFGTGLNREAQQARTPTPGSEALRFDFWGRPIASRRHQQLPSPADHLPDAAFGDVHHDHHHHNNKTSNHTSNHEHDHEKDEYEDYDMEDEDDENDENDGDEDDDYEEELALVGHR